MSHQGLPGWFPECIVCGAGNLERFVCVIPIPAEQHGPVQVEDRPAPDERYEADGHWWHRCSLCPIVVLADPFSFGSYGFCIECWNTAVAAGTYPVARPPI